MKGVAKGVKGNTHQHAQERCKLLIVADAMPRSDG